MKKILGATASKELRHNDLEALENNVPDVKFECEHYQHCRVKDFGRINCLTRNSVETCASWQFYNKYKDFDMGRYLGI